MGSFGSPFSLENKALTMTGIVTRPTAARDIPHLPAIERAAAQAFRAIPELAWLADSAVISEADHARFQATARSWVAVQAEQPVAFAVADIIGDTLFVAELSVDTKWQGQGIGRRLMNVVIDVARSRGLSAVTLTTFREVPWNAPFYARLGFEIVAESELSPALQQQLDEEEAHGLPRERRCAMRLKL